MHSMALKLKVELAYSAVNSHKKPMFARKLPVVTSMMAWVGHTLVNLPLQMQKIIMLQD